MKNLILKQGMLVEARRDFKGLVKGQRYVVETTSSGGLGTRGDLGIIDLVDGLGTMLDAAFDVAISRDLTLPRGQGASIDLTGPLGHDQDLKQ